MTGDPLADELYSEIARFPIVDSHSHIDPFRPAAVTLDDLLGYHYYTELAHSTGTSHDALRPGSDPRERCRAILSSAERFDNTVQFAWLTEIARTFLGFE